MMSEVFEVMLFRFNRKLVFENATYHPKSLIDMFLNIKIVFLLKNTTSTLQPLDAEIIQNLKIKYRKSLVKYVFWQINNNSCYRHEQIR